MSRSFPSTFHAVETLIFDGGGKVNRKIAGLASDGGSSAGVDSTARKKAVIVHREVVDRFC